MNETNLDDGHESDVETEVADKNDAVPDINGEIAEGEDHLEPLDVEITPITTQEPELPPEASTSVDRSSPTPLYDDPSDEDDGEGEWITPSNVALHKSRALDLLPEDGTQSKGKQVIIGSGCMTADFAMQNVLLQMGLNLVGLEGKRIERVKSWVLRCHACFKYVNFFLSKPLHVFLITLSPEYAKIIQKSSALHAAIQHCCGRL